MNTNTNAMHIDLNDMYIEDADMSFDQLEDNLSDVQVEDASMGVENVDAEDLYDEDDDAFDAIEDEEVEEDVEEVEEELEEEHDASDVDESEEEEEVDFEEYDVTLPNGDVIKLHEAINGYKAAQELAEARAAFEAEKESYSQTNSGIKRMLDLAKLEAERVIEDYKDFDWAELSRTDPQAYVENREFLDKYRARHKEIVAEMEFVETKLNEEKASEVKEKASKANEILNRDIPGWNKDLYVDLMTYAVKELGMDEDFVVNTVDAGFFKAIHKAKQLEQGKQTVKAKIKRLGGAPKKVVKAAPKAKATVNSKSAELKRKLEAGQADDRDLGDIFSMLED